MRENERGTGWILKARYGVHPDHSDFVALCLTVKVGTETGPYGTQFFEYVPQPDADELIRQAGVLDVAHMAGMPVEIETDWSGNRPSSRVVRVLREEKAVA